MMNIEYDNVVKVMGEINIQTLQNFIEETDKIIMAYNQYKQDVAIVKGKYIREFDRITIEISSYGGCTDVGSAMLDRIDQMRKIGLHVDTHTSGMAYSMAFILHCYGERRTAGRFAKFMNHGSSVGMGGKVDVIRNTSEFYQQCDAQFDSILLANTKMPKERIEMAHLKEDWIFYDEAIELDIVNVYDGMEESIEERSRRFTQAIDLAIDTFAQVFGTENEEDGMCLLFDGLAQALGIDLDEVEELLNEKEEREKQKEQQEEFNFEETFEECDGQCDECDKRIKCSEEMLREIKECREEEDCEKCDFKDICRDNEEKCKLILKQDLGLSESEIDDYLMRAFNEEKEYESVEDILDNLTEEDLRELFGEDEDEDE